MRKIWNRMIRQLNYLFFWYNLNDYESDRYQVRLIYMVNFNKNIHNKGWKKEDVGYF